MYKLQHLTNQSIERWNIHWALPTRHRKLASPGGAAAYQVGTDVSFNMFHGYQQILIQLHAATNQPINQSNLYFFSVPKPLLITSLDFILRAWSSASKATKGTKPSEHWGPRCEKNKSSAAKRNICPKMLPTRQRWSLLKVTTHNKGS